MKHETDHDRMIRDLASYLYLSMPLGPTPNPITHADRKDLEHWLRTALGLAKLKLTEDTEAPTPFTSSN